MAGDAISETASDASGLRHRTIRIAEIALSVITAIVFLRRICRANKNARELGAGGMRFTLGWAAGWYFAPL
jgi:Domain of unknown function (DUF4328)